MKKIQLLALAFSFFLFACNKDDKNDDNSFYLTCKIDGTEKAFNSKALAVITSEESDGIGLYGATSTTAGADVLIFALGGTDFTATAKTYTYEDLSYEMFASYLEGATENSYDAGSDLSRYAVTTDYPVANHFKLVITSISNTTVKGTFSGDFFLDADHRGTKKTITDGKFNLALVRE